MATVTKKLNPAQIQALYKKLKPLAVRESQPQYTHWQLKTSEMTVTAYTSGKVVYQGKDVDWLKDDNDVPAKTKTGSASKNAPASASGRLANTFPQAGSDEVGNGDFLGPFVVASVIVPDAETAQILHDLKVTDSKAMTDEAIRKVAPRLLELLPCSIQVLDNTRYNEIYDRQTMNLNTIKALMHNQAYLNLIQKGHALPKLVVIDQFCQPKTYYSYLKNQPEVIRTIHFETKAESKYQAVAAASVLARWKFLQVMDALEDKYGMPLAKGGGAQATASAKKIQAKFGREELKHVAKLHFVNMNKL